MAANGSRPDCLASISAWLMRPCRRTLAFMALPDAWNCCLFLAASQQVVEAMAVCVPQWLGQGFTDEPVGSGDGFSGDALDDIQRRDDDVPVAQCVKDAGSQHGALVCLPGHSGRHAKSRRCDSRKSFLKRYSRSITIAKSFDKKEWPCDRPLSST